MSRQFEYRLNDIIELQPWLIVKNTKIEQIFQALKLEFVREGSLINLYPYLQAHYKWLVPITIYTPTNDYILAIEYEPNCFLISGELIRDNHAGICKHLSEAIGCCHLFYFDWYCAYESWGVARNGKIEGYADIIEYCNVTALGDTQTPEMQYVLNIETGEFSVIDFIKVMTGFDIKAFWANEKISGTLNAYLGRGSFTHIPKMIVELPNKSFNLTDLPSYKKEQKKAPNEPIVNWEFLEYIGNINEYTDLPADHPDSLPF